MRFKEFLKEYYLEPMKSLGFWVGYVITLIILYLLGF